MIARVAIDAALDRLFDYEIPAVWTAQAVPGARVTVPFGHRISTGYIVDIVAEAATGVAAPIAAAAQGEMLLSLEESSPTEPLPATRPRPSLKALLTVEGERPFILPSLLKLARWMAGYYCAPLERCLQAVLPGPVRSGRTRNKERLFVEAVGKAGTTPHARPAGGRQEKAASKSSASRPSIASTISIPATPLRTQQPTVANQPQTLTPRQQELLDNIRRVGGGWLQSVCSEFSCSPETLRKLDQAGAVTVSPRTVRRDPLANRNILPTRPLTLNPDQAAALAAVVAACGTGDDVRDKGTFTLPHPQTHTPTNPTSDPHPQPRPILLYGVTGSGKTEVYLQAIAHVLSLGRGAIVLVPEIALTPQTVQRFAGRFGNNVAVLHSALGDGERHDEWQRIRQGEARVVVGPRSAVFAPVERLGLIVVDEEHEPSYKQDETPRYHARDVAVMRGHIEKCPVLLGSATPALESWHNVQRGKYTLERLKRRADGAAMPAVQIIDMRRELERSGHVQVLSQFLIDAVRARLERGEQTMLFLNRRGYSTSLSCPACGFVAECKACNVAFTYHRVDDCLRCHICGAWERPVQVCPACADPKFRYAGFGTQRIEQIVAKCFPGARLGRMDADSTARKLSHDDILGTFRAGRTDILIGTQMIAKGLHFPNVTLVGIVLADSSLHLPDFRAGERTFQLLAQVSGRAGRGAVPGEVIIQTYTPSHPAVVAACTEDFEAFAAGELPIRRQLGYPPYAHLASLTLRGKDETRTSFTAEALARRLKAAAGDEVTVSEACPAPLAKAKNHYRYQIILRAPATRAIAEVLRPVLRAERLPPGVHLAADIDAVGLL